MTTTQRELAAALAGPGPRPARDPAMEQAIRSIAGSRSHLADLVHELDADEVEWLAEVLDVWRQVLVEKEALG